MLKLLRGCEGLGSLLVQSTILFRFFFAKELGLQLSLSIHLCSLEGHLLVKVLLVQILSQRGLFFLVGLVNYKSEVAYGIRFTQSNCLFGLAVAGLVQGALFLQFFEHKNVISELGFDVLSLSQTLISIFLQKQLQVLLPFDELLGEEVAEPLELCVGQALVQYLCPLFLQLLLLATSSSSLCCRFLIRSLCWLLRRILEHSSDVPFCSCSFCLVLLLHLGDLFGYASLF